MAGQIQRSHPVPQTALHQSRVGEIARTPWPAAALSALSASDRLVRRLSLQTPCRCRSPPDQRAVCCRSPGDLRRPSDSQLRPTSPARTGTSALTRRAWSGARSELIVQVQHGRPASSVGGDEGGQDAVGQRPGSSIANGPRRAIGSDRLRVGESNMVAGGLGRPVLSAGGKVATRSTARRVHQHPPYATLYIASPFTARARLGATWIRNEPLTP